MTGSLKRHKRRGRRHAAVRVMSHLEGVEGSGSVLDCSSGGGEASTASEKDVPE